MTHITRACMGIVVLATSLALVGGCASNKNKVKCDGRLEPINKPAPVKSARSTQLSPSVATTARTSAPQDESEGK